MYATKRSILKFESVIIIKYRSHLSIDLNDFIRSLIKYKPVFDAIG